MNVVFLPFHTWIYHIQLYMFVQRNVIKPIMGASIWIVLPLLITRDNVDKWMFSILLVATGAWVQTYASSTCYWDGRVHSEWTHVTEWTNDIWVLECHRVDTYHRKDTCHRMDIWHRVDKCHRVDTCHCWRPRASYTITLYTALQWDRLYSYASTDPPRDI